MSELLLFRVWTRRLVPIALPWGYSLITAPRAQSLTVRVDAKHPVDLHIGLSPTFPLAVVTRAGGASGSSVRERCAVEDGRA